MNRLTGPEIEDILAGMKVDDVRRFSHNQLATVHSGMRNLKEFGRDGRKYYFRTFYYQAAGESIVVRLA